MSKQFIYVGQYFHRHNKELNITEKKIGLTKNLEDREKGLNNTKMTIGYTYVAAWEVDDMHATELALHRILSHDKLTGEWFEDPKNDLVKRVDGFINALGIGEQVELTIDPNDKEATELIKKSKGTVQNTESKFNDRSYFAKYEALKTLAIENGLNVHVPPSELAVIFRKGIKAVACLWYQKDRMHIDTCDINHKFYNESSKVFNGWKHKPQRNGNVDVFVTYMDENSNNLEDIIERIVNNPRA